MKYADRVAETTTTTGTGALALAGDAWALGTVGLRYDWLGAAGVPWGRRWANDSRWFCSEHAEMWQQQAGLVRFVRDTGRGIGPNISYRVA